MVSKQLEVMKWLKEVLGESEVPPFERSESNVNKLHKLMIAYKEASEDAVQVQDYMETKSKSYEDCSNLLKRNWKDLDFSLDFLTEDEQRCMDSLGSLYYDLNLHSSSASNIMLAISSLEEENSKIEEDLAKETRFTGNLMKLSKNVARNLEEMKQICDDAEREASEQSEERLKEEKKAHFFEQKIVTYEDDLKAHETKLKEVGFDDEISLPSVSAKVDQLSKKEKEVEDKTTKLASYNLPPDLSLAEVKVEEVRQLLAETMKSIVHTYVNKN